MQDEKPKKDPKNPIEFNKGIKKVITFFNYVDSILASKYGKKKVK